MKRNYKVRCTRNPDGSYTMSYGKGSKKITAVLSHDPNNGWAWGIYGDEGEHYGEDGVTFKRDCVASFGYTADEYYNAGIGMLFADLDEIDSEQPVPLDDEVPNEYGEALHDALSYASNEAHRHTAPCEEPPPHEDEYLDKLTQWDFPSFTRLVRRYGNDNLKLFMEAYAKDGEKGLL